MLQEYYRVLFRYFFLQFFCIFLHTFAGHCLLLDAGCMHLQFFCLIYSTCCRFLLNFVHFCTCINIFRCYFNMHLGFHLAISSCKNSQLLIFWTSKPYLKCFFFILMIYLYACPWVCHQHRDLRLVCYCDIVVLFEVDLGDGNLGMGK